jgi:hypothetical protein
MSPEEYAAQAADPADPHSVAFRAELEHRNLTPEKRERLKELRRRLQTLREEVEE